MAGTTAKAFGANVDFLKNQLLNAAAQSLSADPGSPATGQFYFNTTSNLMRWYNGSAWIDPLARANHSGSQTSSTISDLGTVLSARSLSSFAAPTADLPIGGFKLTGVADPVNPQDATSKNYVDNALQSAAAGIDSKPSVRALANSNITLSGTQTIDGVALSAGDRVLARGQTTASANGVYVVAAGSWARAADADQNNELTPGAFWYVEEGTTYGKTQWRIENTGTITVGTTAITINQFGAASAYSAGNGLNLVGTVFSVNPASGGGISVTGAGVAVDSTVGRKVTGTIGDGSSTSITITHNLGNQYPTCSFWDTTTGGPIDLNVTATNSSTLTVAFTTAPATGRYAYTLIG